MFISMVLCLFVCCLVLFFLFPRSVTLTPVSVLSVTVYFSNDSVDLQVTVSNTSAVFNANASTCGILSSGPFPSSGI